MRARFRESGSSTDHSAIPECSVPHQASGLSQDRAAGSRTSKGTGRELELGVQLCSLGVETQSEDIVEAGIAQQNQTETRDHGRLGSSVALSECRLSQTRFQRASSAMPRNLHSSAKNSVSRILVGR